MEDDRPPIDLEALEQYLDSDLSPDDCMGLSDLDGFLTAIVIGPELIPPSEWLRAIWGGGEPEFETEAEARTIVGTIMGRYNEIATCFETDPYQFQPLFLEGPGGQAIASDWAFGFLDAVALRPLAWEPLGKDREAGIMLEPFLVVSGDAELPVGRDGVADVENFMAEAPDIIATCTLGIHAFWKKYRARPGKAPRRGRNRKR